LGVNIFGQKRFILVNYKWHLETFNDMSKPNKNVVAMVNICEVMYNQQ